MNGANLNGNEEAVLAEFEGFNPGAWLSRAWLENDLVETMEVMDQRTLDRALGRLIDMGHIVRMPTNDRGSMYALSSVEREFPELKEFARECNTRSRLCCAQVMPPYPCPDCGAMIYVPMARETGKPFGCRDAQSDSEGRTPHRSP